MKILITGSNGQIGWELVRAFNTAHDVVAATRQILDLTSAESIRACISSVRPDLIINPAAHTAVDLAESEPELVRAINATAVGVIGEQARAIGAAVIQFSTDYVFDGTKRTPYLPTDKPNPQSVYGASKLEGERLLAASGARHLILRTCWVYGMRGRNFVLAILRAAKERPHLSIVNDQTGCPTWCRMVARVTHSIVNNGLTGDPGDRHFAGREGIYHVAGAGGATWFEFAHSVFDEAGITPKPTILPITTAQFGAKAHRPACSVLDCSSTESAFNLKMDPWRDSLRAALGERVT